MASDPGRKRFQQAAKATISLISSVFTTLLILRLTGNTLITPAVVSGMVGMIGIIAVMDDTKLKKKVTTLLMGIAASLGILIGSLLAGHSYYLDVVMILVIFSSFYFTRYGSRYFSLCMIGFMMIYISSLLNLTQNELSWFFMGIILGVGYAFMYNFILFQDAAQILKRSMRSFHIQINLTFNLLIRMIEDPELSSVRMQSLEKNVRKLSEYARAVSGELNAQDVKESWPGLETSQLRLYVFDTEMFVETLTDSIRSLKKADAFEITELRDLLVWVVKALRDAEVLSPIYEERHLEEAEKAVQALRLVIMDLLEREEQPKGWIYLIRRIESIANHVVEEAITIQQSLHMSKKGKDESEEKDESLEKSDASKNEKGLKPSTKKAYQALVASILSIIVGQIISPNQPYWVLLAAFIVLLGTESIGRTYIKGYQRSFGTIIGAVLGFALAKLVSGQFIIELILLFLSVFLAFFLFSVSYTLMSVFITMLVAFMYDLLLGGISLSLLGARVIDTIVGAAIAIAVSVVIFPKKTRDRVADGFHDFLAELKPYLTDYVRGFREDVNIKELTESAFNMDQKLQSIRDEARSLLQRPGALSDAGIARWITVFTAISYYARHLVASTYRKNFQYPGELIDVFKQIEEKLNQNIETLSKLVKGTESTAPVYSLMTEREQIERLSPSRNQSQRDLIHHLYYVWQINHSIVALAIDLGASEE